MGNDKALQAGVNRRTPGKIKVDLIPQVIQGGKCKASVDAFDAPEYILTGLLSVEP